MSDEGKIASRIFSKHLKIQDEFDEEQEEQEQNEQETSGIKLNLTSSDNTLKDPQDIKQGNKLEETTDDIANVSEDKVDVDTSQTSKAVDELPEVEDASEEFIQTEALENDTKDIMTEGSNDFLEGESKMLNDNNKVNTDEVDDSIPLELEDLSFHDPGETLVFNFEPINTSNEESHQADSNNGLDNLFNETDEEQEAPKNQEMDDFKIEEFPEEIPLFNETQSESSEQTETTENINFESWTQELQPETINIGSWGEQPEFQEESQASNAEEIQESKTEEFPEEISLFNDIQAEGSEQPKTPESINFESWTQESQPETINIGSWGEQPEAREDEGNNGLSEQSETFDEPIAFAAQEFEQTSQAEEFPEEIPLFTDIQSESSEQAEASKEENLETIEEESQPEIINFSSWNEQSETNESLTSDSLPIEPEGEQTPMFNFENKDNEQQEWPVNNETADGVQEIEMQNNDVQEVEIQNDTIEDIAANEVERIEENSGKESEKYTALLEFSNMQGVSFETKEFLANNMSAFTKERLAICADLGLDMDDLKGFFIGSLTQELKKEVYKKLREVEMQYIFEDFIQCFNIESFDRMKEAIDGSIVRNIVALKEDIFIDGYEAPNTAQDIDIIPGESAFILSNEFEINIESYIEEIKTAKMNVDNVYIMILDGASVDENAVKLANKYGIRIVDMDIPISRVNKNLEEIKRGIIA